MKQQKNKISVLEQQLRQNETLYHNACEVFGGSPRVFRHYSPAEEMSIDILTVPIRRGKEKFPERRLALCIIRWDSE